MEHYTENPFTGTVNSCIHQPLSLHEESTLNNLLTVGEIKNTGLQLTYLTPCSESDRRCSENQNLVSSFESTLSDWKHVPSSTEDSKLLQCTSSGIISSVTYDVNLSPYVRPVHKNDISPKVQEECLKTDHSHTEGRMPSPSKVYSSGKPLHIKVKLLPPETVIDYSSSVSSAPELKPQISQSPEVSHKDQKALNVGRVNECSSKENLSDGSVFVSQNNKVLYAVTSRNIIHVLKPVLSKLICQNPEAVAFRYPDYHKFKNYREIVKNPMCFSTVKVNLESRVYENAWDFISDVWLIFKNAMLYFSKSSRNYRYAVKLSELFKNIIDQPMQSLGYCCGQLYYFEPRPIPCYNKINCFILKNDKYWCYNEKYNFCKKCISSIKENVFEIVNDTEKLILRKDELVEKRNNTYKDEEFVACKICARKFHRICALHFDEIWKAGYICPFCLRFNGLIKKIPYQFTSKNLPETNLSIHLEKRVNNYLKMMNANTEVVIRVVCQDKREFLVQEGAKSRFVESGVWPESFPYTSRTILAFQKCHGWDVCFFSMFVQEYDSNCPQPNSRRVYISYLDSVHFFTPKSLRTSVYHELILAYLEDVKRRGFMTAQLWSCPSNTGEDYVFYCHPSGQKNPNVKRLQDWYKQMLNKGIRSGIVISYQTLFNQVLDDKLNSVSQLPYFEGDFWPGIIENEIFKLDGKSEKVIESVQRSVMLEAKEEVGKEIILSDVKKGFMCKKARKSMKHSRSSSLPQTGDIIIDKIYEILSKHKLLFLVIHLRLDEGGTTDPNSPIQSNLFSTRESFLEFCRVQDCEFSSLRRAKFSTMVFLYELHKEKVDAVVCNICRLEIKTGKHCKVCKDFDLCLNCYNLNGHYHDVENLKTGFEGGVHVGYKKIQVPPKKIAAHVSTCFNANCKFKECRQFKSDEEHFRMSLPNIKNCKTCEMYIKTAYYHFLDCQYDLCHIAFCRVLKKHRNQRNQLNGKVCIPDNQIQVPTGNSSFPVYKQNVDGLTNMVAPSQVVKTVNAGPFFRVDSTDLSSLSYSIATNHSIVPLQRMDFQNENSSIKKNEAVEIQGEFNDVPKQSHVLKTESKSELGSSFDSKLCFVNKTKSGVSPGELKYCYLPEFTQTKSLPGVFHNKEGNKLQLSYPISNQEHFLDENQLGSVRILSSHISSPHQPPSAPQTKLSKPNIISFRRQLSNSIHSSDSGEIKPVASVDSSTKNQSEFIFCDSQFNKVQPALKQALFCGDQHKNANMITGGSHLPAEKNLENILSKSGVNFLSLKSAAVETKENSLAGLQCNASQCIGTDSNIFPQMPFEDNSYTVTNVRAMYNAENVKSGFPTAQLMQNSVNASGKQIYAETLPNSSFSSLETSVPQNAIDSNTYVLSNVVQPVVFNFSGDRGVLAPNIDLRLSVNSRHTAESKNSQVSTQCVDSILPQNSLQSSYPYITSSVSSSQSSDAVTYIFNPNCVLQDVYSSSKELKSDAAVPVSQPNVHEKNPSNSGNFAKSGVIKYLIRQKTVGGTNQSSTYASVPCQSMPNTAVVNFQKNKPCLGQASISPSTQSSQNYVTLQLINAVQAKKLSIKRKQYFPLIPNNPSKKMYKLAQVKNIGTSKDPVSFPVQCQNVLEPQAKAERLPGFNVLKPNASFQKGCLNANPNCP